MDEKLKKDIREYLKMIGISSVVLLVVLDLNTRLKPDTKPQSAPAQNKERGITDNGANVARDSVAMLSRMHQNNRAR